MLIGHLQTILRLFHTAAYLRRTARKTNNQPGKLHHEISFTCVDKYPLGKEKKLYKHRNCGCMKILLSSQTSSSLFCKLSSKCFILSVLSLSNAFFFSIQELIIVGLNWLAKGLRIVSGSSIPINL